jgi:hypothetical protein
MVSLERSVMEKSVFFLKDKRRLYCGAIHGKVRSVSLSARNAACMGAGRCLPWFVLGGSYGKA